MMTLGHLGFTYCAGEFVQGEEVEGEREGREEAGAIVRGERRGDTDGGYPEFNPATAGVD